MTPRPIAVVRHGQLSVFHPAPTTGHCAKVTSVPSLRNSGPRCLPSRFSVRLASSSTAQEQELPWPPTPEDKGRAGPAQEGISYRVRRILRHLPQPVVVCTSTSPPPSPPRHSPSPTTTTASRPLPHAMTVSSFASLSMMPRPLVSFNIATPSRTLDAIRASRRFAVHMLHGSRAGRCTAEWFSRRYESEVEAFRGAAGAEGGPGLAALERPPGADVEAARDGAGGEEREQGAALAPPILRGQGILYVLVCRLPEDVAGRGLLSVRDHVIVVGEVEEVVAAGEEDGTAGELAIAYGHGRYWRQKEVIE